MDNMPDENNQYIMESDENGENKEAELVAKIDDDLDLYVNEDGEAMLVSGDENLSGARAMHRFYNSEAYRAMTQGMAKENVESDDAKEDAASGEYGSLEDALEDPASLETALFSIVAEDALLDNIGRIISIIENLTDEQVEKLGPDGVEEVFIALSKFYYSYMQTTNPLWEVAQTRYSELKKWQKLYMDKYYHKV